MTAHALHFPERRGLTRWAFAGLAIALAHAAIVVAIALWYLRAPPAPTTLPPIAISFAPVESTTQAAEDDKTIGIPQEQVEARPPEPPKEEKPVDQPIDKLMPAPPQPADVTLPKPVERAEEKKPVEQRQAQEARAAGPKNEAAQVASIAASRAYSALVSGHLRRFIRTAAAARYGSGKAFVLFVLDRDGHVLSSKLQTSSGNAALDREAMEIVNRANPFPAFPAVKLEAQETFSAPITFERQ